MQVLFTAVYYSLMKLIKKNQYIKKTKQFSCLLGYVLHSLTFHILFQFVCISHFVFIEFQVCYSLLSIPKLSHINVYFSIHQSIIVLLSLSELQEWLEPIPATKGERQGAPRTGHQCDTGLYFFHYILYFNLKVMFKQNFLLILDKCGATLF